MEKKHVPQSLKHIIQHKRDKNMNLKYADRQFPPTPHISQPVTVKPSLEEDGAAPASGMSISANPAPSLTDPNVGYAFKKLRQKRIKESMRQLTRTLSGRDYSVLPPEKKRKESTPLMNRIKNALKLRTASIKVAEGSQTDHTHAAHFQDSDGNWSGMALIKADSDKEAIEKAHDLAKSDRYKDFNLAHVEKHVPVKEEIEHIVERGEDSKGYKRSTESGAGLTRKGAKAMGVKTAVTTPPSKLDPNGKAAKRRKSFCARMSGMKGPMKDEKGRPTRKAMSLRRWNCNEGSLKSACWKGYTAIGMKKKNGKEVPNCVPVKENDNV